MAKFWYLATVITMPNWFLKPTEKLVFESLWSVSKDPIKREIVYLPIECGGLGLLNPGIQQRALRLSFLQNIINPLCNTKWVILASILDWLPISKRQYPMDLPTGKQLTKTG